MEPLFRSEPYSKSCAARVLSADDRGVKLDRTVFYPTGGGQPGDSGALVLADGSRIAVVGAIKGEAPDEVIHQLAPGSVAPAPGTDVMAELDWARRHKLMRMHSCLHLLSAILPYPVTGGQVGEDKGRLDFDIPDPIKDKEELTAALNKLIAGNHEVAVRWITDAELASKPDLVKTMAVKPPTGLGRVRLVEVDGLDLQPCGGTHVSRTAEIGPVEIVKIEKKGRLNRRVIVMFRE
jgi:misacylated tRNA(Ala) deacylase